MSSEKERDMMVEAAVIQMSSSLAIGMNLVAIKRLVSDAATQGAKLVVLPDKCTLFSFNAVDYIINKEILGEGRIQNFIQKLSEENNIWIIASGIPIVSVYAQKKFYITTVVYNSLGRLVDVHYHLRPVLPPAYQWASTALENQEYGEQVKTIETPYAKIGLLTTYDLFYPEVFLYLKQQGSDVFALSAAMPSDLGSQVWTTLLKARAIENSATIMVANQSGFHEDANVFLYGNSMVVDPQGKIAQSESIGEQILMTELKKDTLKSRDIKQGLFTLQYRR